MSHLLQQKLLKINGKFELVRENSEDLILNFHLELRLMGVCLCERGGERLLNNKLYGDGDVISY